MMMGFVIMPLEKLNALFGLILMTQYFTHVTTSVSLLSSSKSSLSPSLSDSSSKSLLLSPSSHSSSQSSTHFLWPTSSHQHHGKNSHSHSSGATMPFSHHHFHSPTNTRLTLMLENEVPIKISHNSKHQKRHVGENNSSHGNHGNRAVVVGEKVVEADSSVVTPHREAHLLTTLRPTVELSVNSSTTSIFRSNSRTDRGNNRDERNRDFRGKCRHKTYLPPNVFTLDTCAWCYKYIRDDLPTFGIPSKKLKDYPYLIEDPQTNQSYVIRYLVFNGSLIIANVSDPESPIWKTFATENARKDWTGCCQAAKECCERMVAPSKYNEESELDGILEPDNITLPLENECPPTWDGWQCWDSTKAGITAKSYCPRYVYFITEPPTCSIPLIKECSSNGTWAQRSGKEWTNYAVCVKSTVALQQNRSYVLVTAYGISIVALIPAMIIFFSYKQLRVHRIILHQNLFCSLIVNALLTIIFKTLVMMSETNETNSTLSNSIVSQNSIACRLLLISTKYSRMTNYMWMLSEGFYLHKLIAAAFAEQKSLLVFYLIGWVFPLFPVAFYAGFRLLAANDKCWVVPQDEWEWALNGPSLLSLLVNALFLINIIRVLVTKLRAAHAQEPSQYRKAVRATLVLLPLFGLHFIVTIYRPSSSKGVCQNWTELYFYANDVLDGMQGFLVALIFCYCNGEVLSLLKRTYKRWKEQHFDVGPRRNSHSRHRPSRGSVMGRSVVSTHIYSSIPPSPETNVIALPSGSNPSSKDPSPSSQLVGTSLLTVNGSSGPITITSNVSPDVNKSDIKSSLKNRKNHTSSTTNGNAINMYVSSEYGSAKDNSGVEISCV